MTNSRTPQTQPDAIVTTRGGIIESTHLIHSAITDSRGRLLFSIGNPDRLTLIRSAAKPAQALAILETGAFKTYPFDDADLALICASHSAENSHMLRAGFMLARIGASEEDLKCGGHASLNPEVNRQWAKNDFEPTRSPIANNCSGKHAGMIAGAKALGDDIATYHLSTNRVQQKVAEVVADLTSPHRSSSPSKAQSTTNWAIDGCNLPAPAMPLTSLANMYAFFAESSYRVDDSPEAEPNNHPRERSAARIYRAMTTYPENVAGTDRFCTNLIRAYSGHLIGKVGADGCYGIAIKQCSQTKNLGAVGAIGIGVKVEDGNLDILYKAVPEILERLGIAPTRGEKGLVEVADRRVRNTAGVVTGEVRYEFEVRRCGEGGMNGCENGLGVEISGVDGERILDARW